MRIGEAMVKEGLITNDQLAKALERQIIFGGRLGTNLVEMGLINEEVLAQFLSKVLRVPYAEPSFFADVGQDVLDSISKELVEKYTAFPIKRERSRLHLAMKDPNDMQVLDEMRFIVGLDIRAYIASEMRIVFALEKYYGIKRDLRYVSVKGADETYDDHAAAAPAAATPSSPSSPRTVVPQISEEDYLGDESQMDYGGFGQGGPTLASASDFLEGALAPPAQTTSPVPPPIQQSVQAEPPPPPVRPAPPPQPVQAAPPQPVQAAPPQPPVQAAPPPASAPVAAPASPYEVLAAPHDREQIAGAVLDAACEQLGRAALFLVKGPVLSGWRAKGVNLTDKMVAQVALNLAEPNMFKDVIEDKAFYKGPILQVAQNNQLMAALGGFYPQEAIAYPLIIKGKVVGVLYGDNGQGSFIAGNVEKLTSLMGKASMSLEILILKTKILADS